MTESDLKFFKSFLLNQKSSLLNKSLEFKSQQRNGRDFISDEAEVASHDLELNLTINLHERDRIALLQIEKALSKIYEGSYGNCEGCGESIEIRRLKARPFATFCIDCMEEHENLI